MGSLADDTAEFVDPPANSRKRRSGKWIDRLAVLRERPGEWARWPEKGVTRSAGPLNRQGRTGEFGPGKWEFTNRTVDGVTYLYARLNGGDD